MVGARPEAMAQPGARLTVVFFALAALVAFMGLAFAAGYVVGKLLL